MDLPMLVDPARCVADARYVDKAACLGDLAKRAAAALGLEKAAILSALVHRESLGSTGLGNGIALPHARIPGLAAPFVMAVHLLDPIAFEAVDDKRVDIVCLVLVPAAEAQGAPNVFACVARRLRDPAALAAIRKAKTPEALHAALTAA